MAVHRFEPTHYHITLASHEPVVTIRDGDTVVTSTVDAGGCDAYGAQVAGSPNPQTGPFFVEGAEPGDTLAVRLDRLCPNRSHGYSNLVVLPNVVDPGFPLPEQARCEWQVDCESGTATLVRPETELGAFTVPLSPMLGCFGVAPAGGQAISASTAGPHGGNMDYRGFVSGVTAYLPVLVPGALFSVGDGHAVQGAGEVVGMGIEISFDVQFTVRLLKGKRIGWPRGEDDRFFFAVGNARPLDQAVQHATTEMLRWLQDGFGLDAGGASILLGQCAEYDLGNVIDPAFTMVCKVPRHLVEGLRRA